MPSCHPIDMLFSKLQNISPYPEGVVPVPKRMAGTAFFPGGSGLWGTEPNKPLPAMPIGQVMILGHDFGCEADFYPPMGTQGEDLKGSTWRNLLWLLEQVDLAPGICFFTNLYMGVRTGNTKVTGRFPGSRCPRFVQLCQTFLTHQIATQRPRLILTLGVHVPSILAPLSPDLSGWKRCKRFQDLDGEDRALIPQVNFGQTINVRATVAALTHPCMWHRCVMMRHYGKLVGRQGELTLLQDAIQIAGIR